MDIFDDFYNLWQHDNLFDQFFIDPVLNLNCFVLTPQLLNYGLSGYLYYFSLSRHQNLNLIGNFLHTFFPHNAFYVVDDFSDLFSCDFYFCGDFYSLFNRVDLLYNGGLHSLFSGGFFHQNLFVVGQVDNLGNFYQFRGADDLIDGN